MAYTMEWKGNRVKVQWHGVVDDADIARLADRIAADERCDALLSILHDFRECTRLVFSADSLEDVAAKSAAARLSIPQMQRVVVTTRDDVRAACAAYRSADFSGNPLQVFDTMDAAQAWLLQETGKKNKGK